MPVPADRFDEIRRKWIARNQHTFIFQKRRAEILARQIRDRATENSGARVDPADDDVIHPFLMRSHQTKYAAVDAIVVVSAAVLAPLGWPLGRLLYKLTVQLIPEGIRVLSDRGVHVGGGRDRPADCRCCMARPTPSSARSWCPTCSHKFRPRRWRPVSTAFWRAGWRSRGHATGGRCGHRPSTRSSTSAGKATT